MAEWFADLFDERYLSFYEGLLPARPATREAAFVAEALALPPGSRVLDLGCGTGRHSVALALCGHEVTGLDLSPTLLATASALAQEQGVAVTLLRRDLRDLAGLGPFDACVSLYTAFGYFEGDGDARVLAAIRAALQPAGQLLLDLTNFAPLLRPQVSTAWREQERSVTREVHTYDPHTGVLVTERTLFRKTGGVVALPTSRVRAYLPYEVRALLARAGFTLDRVLGDLADVPFEWDRSPRQVYVARRSDALDVLCPV